MQQLQQNLSGGWLPALTRALPRLCLVAVVATFTSCLVVTRVPLTESPTKENLVVLLELGLFGDGRAVVVDKITGRKEELFRIAFSDDNKRILQLEWSADGQRVGWLIADSGPSAGARRLLVFDLANFPGAPVERQIDSVEPVSAFRLLADRTVYELRDGSQRTFDHSR